MKTLLLALLLLMTGCTAGRWDCQPTVKPDLTWTRSLPGLTISEGQLKCQSHF